VADEHTRRMFQWRSQVGDDHRLTPFDFRIAYAVAERVYRDTSCAKTSQAQLAADVGATIRGVQKALRRLSEHKHLQVEDNSKRGRINRYWPIIRAESVEDRAADQGTNGCSYPLNETPELPFVPPPNSGSEEVRTTVRTEELLKGTSEGPSENISANKKMSANKEAETAFEEWYGLYPKHVARGAALKAYRRALSQGATVEELKLGAMRYTTERTGQDPKFTAHPATWLNAGRWMDEPDNPAKPAVSSDLPLENTPRPKGAPGSNGYARIARGWFK
jgi:hypothetical protein